VIQRQGTEYIFIFSGIAVTKMADKYGTVLGDIKQNIAMAQFRAFRNTCGSSRVLQNGRIFLMLYRRFKINNLYLIYCLSKVRKLFIRILCCLTINSTWLLLTEIQRMRRNDIFELTTFL